MRSYMYSCARLLAPVLLVVAAATSASAQFTPMPGGANSMKGMPIPMKGVGIEQKLDQQVPLDLTFRDSDGQSVQLRQYFRGKPVLLSLVYFDCPMLCPQTLDALERSLALLKFDVGNEFEVLTVSFNPQETPELAAKEKDMLLKAYNRAGAADGWHFLTGDEQSINALTSAVGFSYTYDAQSKQYAHATGIMILTPQGKISRYLYGIEYPPKDLRLGLVEASNEKIGSPVDVILLCCFRYDSKQGKYTFFTYNLIRAGGVAILLVLGGVILAARRVNKKRARYLAEHEANIST